MGHFNPRLELHHQMRVSVPGQRVWPVWIGLSTTGHLLRCSPVVDTGNPPETMQTHWVALQTQIGLPFHRNPWFGMLEKSGCPIHPGARNQGRSLQEPPPPARAARTS